MFAVSSLVSQQIVAQSVEPDKVDVNGAISSKSAANKFALTFGVNYIDNNQTKNFAFFNDDLTRFKSAFTLGLTRELGKNSQIGLDLHTNNLEIGGKDNFFIQSTFMYNYNLAPLLFNSDKTFKTTIGAGTGFYSLQNQNDNLLLVVNLGLEVWFTKGLAILVQHRSNIGVLEPKQDVVNNFNQLVFGIKTRL
ncbi:hypothetical protein [Flagellimonas marinaquae]